MTSGSPVMAVELKRFDEKTRNRRENTIRETPMLPYLVARRIAQIHRMAGTTNPTHDTHIGTDHGPS